MVTSSDFTRLNMPRHPDVATGGDCTASADWSIRPVASAARPGSSLGFNRAFPEPSVMSAATRPSELSDSLDGEEAEGEEDDGPLRSAAFAPVKNELHRPLLVLHCQKQLQNERCCNP